MSKVDLDAIEARAKAATPGPWRQGGHYDGEWFDLGKNSGYVRFSDGHEISVAQKAGKYDDAEFIAHARQDVEEMAQELRVLRAHVASFTKVVHSSPVSEQPDDTEANQALDEAENFVDAALELGDKWGVPYTNNSPRWQDGVWLRPMGEWLADVRKVAERYALELDSEVARQ